MKLGGNGKAAPSFKAFQNSTDVKTKYSSSQANTYKKKLQDLVNKDKRE